MEIADSGGAERLEQMVKIKGVRDGLLVTFNGDADADLLSGLQAELAQKQAFLQGSRVAVDLGERAWDEGQLGSLQTLLAAHQLTLWAVLSEAEETRRAVRGLGLATRLPGSQTDLEGNQLAARSGSDEAPAVAQSENGRPEIAPVSVPDLSNAFFLRETLRSGRSLYHDGHVVLMGDVNPGAQVVASGHVIVWGRLRGMVHAGAHGDETAVICALELSPTQLRIAGQIAVPPDDDRRRPPLPEQAAIRDGQIVAESWPVRY